MKQLVLLFGAAAAGCAAGAAGESNPSLRYIEEAYRRAGEFQSSPGSLYTPAGRFGDLARDLRAFQVDDLVTVIVADRASAVARGVSNSNRKSSAKASVSALWGTLNPAAPLTDLARLGGESQLQGQGETSRETVLTTTLSARVTHVLPNGYLVIEGIKDIQVNSERQQVLVRGVVRWNDIGAGNSVSSDRLANLEVRIQGKGVVGDAVRRPNFLYRLLIGLLPF